MILSSEWFPADNRHIEATAAKFTSSATDGSIQSFQQLSSQYHRDEIKGTQDYTERGISRIGPLVSFVVPESDHQPSTYAKTAELDCSAQRDHGRIELLASLALFSLLVTRLINRVASQAHSPSNMDRRRRSLSRLPTEEELELIPLNESESILALSPPSSSSEECEPPIGSPSKGRRKRLADIEDVDAYMAKREMTVAQERWNALTMIPSPVFCLCFCLMGWWLPDANTVFEEATTPNSWTVWLNSLFGNDRGCLEWSWAPHMPALPPLPVLAVCAGICLQAPFSFIYHWHYANVLPAGLPRTTHWSRRMDQSMIHVASALAAYGTSGSGDFFLANIMYNADCIYRQFLRTVKPKQNQIRIAISILAYTIPILRRGMVALFLECWVVVGVSSWLFSQYPIGGWSHAAFHLVIAFLPPLLLQAAMTAPSSQAQLQLALECLDFEP